MTTPNASRPRWITTPAASNTADATSDTARVDALGVSVPWASVPDEAMVPDNDTSARAATLKLPAALEARLAALEEAIACPWACGANACPWKCEVTA
jgi:hypothetical protein